VNINTVNRTKRGNRYCGPAVISAVTGCTTDDAARAIRHHSGQRAVMGVFDRHLIAAFKSHWDIEAIDVCKFDGPAKSRPTLAQWLRENKSIRTAGRVFLVSAGNHYQLISGRRCVCSLTKDVVSVRDPSVRRRSRVDRVLELKGKPKPTPLCISMLGRL